MALIWAYIHIQMKTICVPVAKDAMSLSRGVSVWRAAGLLVLLTTVQVRCVQTLYSEDISDELEMRNIDIKPSEKIHVMYPGEKSCDIVMEHHGSHVFIHLFFLL